MKKYQLSTAKTQFRDWQIERVMFSRDTIFFFFLQNPQCPFVQSNFGTWASFGCVSYFLGAAVSRLPLPDCLVMLHITADWPWIGKAIKVQNLITLLQEMESYSCCCCSTFKVEIHIIWIERERCVCTHRQQKLFRHSVMKKSFANAFFFPICESLLQCKKYIWLCYCYLLTTWILVCTCVKKRQKINRHFSTSRTRKRKIIDFKLWFFYKLMAFFAQFWPTTTWPWVDKKVHRKCLVKS